MKPLPAPETIADVRSLANPRYASGQLAVMASIAPRAAKVLNRCYAAPAPIPHGFDNPVGFIEACRQRDAHNRLFRALCRCIAAKEVARGRLTLECS